MIVEFTIENFRSYRDEQTLSLYAEKKGEGHPGNVAYPTGGKLGVLKTVGIYGANASGKSNLLRAMAAMRYMVVYSDELKLDDSIGPYEPFLLDARCKDQPVKMGLEFVLPDGIRYRYAIAFTRKEIVHEMLVYYPSRQVALLFERKKADTSETMKFGGSLKGRRRIGFLFNNLYLSKAANAEGSSPEVRAVYRYFRDQLMPGVDLPGSRTSMSYTTRRLIDGDDSFQSKVSDFLSTADTGITGVELTVEEVDETSLVLPEGIPDSVRRDILRSIGHRPTLLHPVNDESDRVTQIAFDLRQESTGTRKMYHLSGRIIDALQDSRTILLDEMDSSMHPRMCEFIVGLFNSCEANPNNAQLIFATHALNLMDSSRMRRDQLWFTQKDDLGATELYALDEFNKNQVRKDSPFGKHYMDGRFRAIPRIRQRGHLFTGERRRDAEASKEE